MLSRLRGMLEKLVLKPKTLRAHVVRDFDAAAGLLYLRLVDESGVEIDVRSGVDVLGSTFDHRGRRVRLAGDARAALTEIAAHGCARGGIRGFAIKEEDAPDVVRALRTTGIAIEAAPGTDDFSFDARPLEVQQTIELEGDESLRRTVTFSDADGKVEVPASVVNAQAHRSWIRTAEGFRKRPNIARDELANATAAAAASLIEGDDVPYYLAKQLEEARRQGRVILGPRAAAARLIDNDWLPRASVDSRGAHIHIDVDMLAGDVAIPLREAEAAKKRRYVRVNGHKDTWAKNDRAAQKKTRQALNAIPQLTELPGNAGFEAPAYTLPLVQEQFAEFGGIRLSESAARLFGQLQDFTQIESAPIPKGLKADLREYQRKGLDWLCFLRRFGLSGILADDMGLGKTLQTCAALLSAAEAGSTGASLVVCPASVLAVWESELRKWCDGLEPVILGPGNRARYLAAPPPNTVAIASYQGVARMADAFQKPVWNYLILDEAHRVKNHNTSMAKACKGVLARHKLAVTGTPIQNRLRELWALYDSIMPDYLGDLREFGRKFETPIQKEKNEAVAEVLRRRIDPFKLRRLKTQVATDLPPFTREHRAVPLLPSQRDLYQRIAEELKLPEVIQSLRASGDPLKGLEKLLRLRQVCAHPRLLDRAAPLRDSSGKFEELAELLDETLEGGHKALVFTQWTGMADLIRDLLNEQGIKHLYLDGSRSGTQRTEIVDTFQRPDGPPVLVVSLLAGGEGITLTQADTVIMYDRWWNPAIEEQAFARAYRIGQGRPVTAYILQSSNTIEEKLALLLEDKKSLAEDLVRVDAFEKRITREQLIALLEDELAATKREDVGGTAQ